MRCRWIEVGLVFIGLCLSGCGHSSHAPSAEASPSSSTADDDASLDLSPQAAARIGVETRELSSVQYQPRVRATAVVIDPQPLFQALADLASSEAAAHASTANAERLAALFNDEGNASAQEREAAEAQHQQDVVRQTALRRQLRSQWGDRFLDADADRVAERLAQGRVALMRMDLLQPGDPEWSSGTFQFEQGDDVLRVQSAWRAPIANPVRPGGSWYALVESPSRLPIGARTSIDLPTNAPSLAGVVVPRSAVIHAEETSWVFVALDNHRYERRRIGTERPLPEGYFTDQVLSAGERVVIQGAGLMLAEQIGTDQDED